MFKDSSMANREAGEGPETIIAAGVQVEGDFVSKGNVLIEGTVKGSLKTDRDLRVGENATIKADVSAANVIVAGEVRGNVSVSEKLELEPSAKVQGDIQAGVLIVSSGATINGQIAMGAQAAVAEPAAEKETSRSASSKATKASKNGKATKEEEVVVEGEEEEKEKEKSAVNAFFR